MAVYDRHAYKNSVYLCFVGVIQYSENFLFDRSVRFKFYVKNLRALTAIVLYQVLIEWMGFFLGIPLSKILVLTVLSSLAEIFDASFPKQKSKSYFWVIKRYGINTFYSLKKTLWLSILLVAILSFLYVD